jgi:hypothetical protein
LWVSCTCSSCHRSWSPCPNTSRPQGLCCLWAPDNSSPLALLPHGKHQLATQCLEPTTTHPSEP